MAALVDIVGAFDNISHDAVSRSLDERHIPPSIKTWYLNYLKNRVLFSDLHGESVKRLIKRGVPQGGCLSPLAYNLATEDMLKKFTNTLVQAIGFADDTCLAISGKKPDYLARVLQTSLIKLERWGESVGLDFSAEKSQILVFSRRTKHPVILENLPPIMLQGRVVEYVTEATYLGMLLDSKLTWKPHLKQKLIACKKS